MSTMGSSQGNKPVLQRIRCRQCQLPLLQVYQGDLLYTLHQNGEQTAVQELPAYFYRTLTDPTPLLTCPRCGGVLSPATLTIVLPRTIIEEG
jgi:hypothetical protein